MPIPFYHPTPSPSGMFRGQPFPYAKANLFSKFYINWIGDVMKVAYSRTMEADDLYAITPDLACKTLGNELEAKFFSSVPSVEKPSLDALRGKSLNNRKYQMSLLKAMLFTVWPQLLISFFVRGFSQGLRVTAPIITKMLITQLTRSHAWHHAHQDGVSTDTLTPPRSVGYMFGLAFALWVMSFMSSNLSWFPWFFSALTGRDLRTAAAFTKGETQDDKWKVDHDAVCRLWLSFLVFVGMGLLISILGYSALLGLAVLVLAGPLKIWMYKQVAQLRQDQTRLIDVRVRLLSETLNNIRAIKLYAYERWFGMRTSEMRKQELSKLSHNNLLRSGLSASMSFIPTLAAILTFVTYSLTGHKLDAAIVFSSLQYFNILRYPISQLPEVINILMDAHVATKRIEELLKAEEMDTELIIQPESPYGIQVKGDFQHEGNAQTELPMKADKKLGNSETKETNYLQQPFTLKGIDLKISKGALICIVGRVGTGKTSLLLGMINEMKQTTGRVVFGGTVSYVPQKAWVQSGSVRDNITFSADSRDVDEEKVEHIIDACALRSDIDMWPNGSQTKIGERGITLSGGQGQRICIARAAYQDSDIVLLDDPLSAVDANVGNHLLEHCILNGPMATSTRILVTHQLDVLPKADSVVVMDRNENGVGRIVQQGPYQDLLHVDGILKNLISNYVSTSKVIASEDPSMSKITDHHQFDPQEEQTIDTTKKKGTTTEPAAKLFLDKEKAQGAVTLSTYVKYAQSMGSWTLPLTCAYLLIMSQSASVLNNLFLGYWSEDKFKGVSQGGYMGIYAGLGGAMALFTWASTYAVFLAGMRASFTMFNKAWTSVMRSGLSWHDRTPTGRIISRLSKDVEVSDDRLASVWYLLLSGYLSVVGAIALILYTYPWVALMMLPVLLYNYLSTCYYRQTSRDLRRLSSVLRSDVYTHFGEQLAGLPVIRAFGQQHNFKRRFEHVVDIENVAFLCGSFLQSKWLGVRLSFSSYLLVLFVAIFGILERNNVTPAKFGVVLTYVISSIATLTNLVSYATEAEQQMNTVERIQYYMDLESEAAPSLPSNPTHSQPWPTQGHIKFQDVQLKYRPELPLVLKGVSFTINPGEKIEVDGVDLGTLGLDCLRERLSIIPQDAFLFGGTVRENIDPTGSHSDAELNSALNLIHHSPSVSTSVKEKFHLDAVVASEGANLSAGEQQLLALVRALVRGSKVLLLDEATSSVDPETDALIQQIIQTELSDITLLSIAHRLQTVAYYDRILVMEAGQIVEKIARQELATIRHDAAAAAVTREELPVGFMGVDIGTDVWDVHM
nr:uncharacterized protein CI109_001359 [Kwoniella shandongensis]KAA5530555.1 hypothetical protein CI109_001359 [Kwoniella shandongensis]